MIKNSYSITYMDGYDNIRYFDVKAYTERQAVYVFHKLVRYTVDHIIQIIKF